MRCRTWCPRTAAACGVLLSLRAVLRATRVIAEVRIGHAADTASSTWTPLPLHAWTAWQQLRSLCHSLACWHALRRSRAGPTSTERALDAVKGRSSIRCDGAVCLTVCDGWGSPCVHVRWKRRLLMSSCVSAHCYTTIRSQNARNARVQAHSFACHSYQRTAIFCGDDNMKLLRRRRGHSVAAARCQQQHEAN